MGLAGENPEIGNGQRKNTRVLLVEDNVADVRLIRELMRESVSIPFELISVGRLAEAVSHIRDVGCDVILLDLGLPDSQGLDTLKTLLESAGNIPVIVLTGLSDDADSVQAIEHGAQDYLVKGRIDGHLLFKSLQYAIGRNLQERALRESEDRYRDLVEHSQDLICTHDLEGRVLSANPWAAKALGYALDELLRMHIHELLVPEMRHEFERYMDELRTHGVARGQMLVQTRKGERRVWEYTNTLRMEGVPKPIIRGMAHDITERMHAEEHLKRASQLESALLRIDTQILEGADTKDVMGTACDAIVGMGYRMCWIGLPDPERIIRVVAYKGFTDGYPENIDIRWDTSSGEKGPTEIAFQTGRPCVIQSIRESPIFGPWREGSLKRGYLSMAVFPLVSEEGESLGVIDVYCSREGAFGDEEVARLRMFAQQCSIAVINARRIENLRDVSQRLAFHVNRMPLACIVWNREFDVMEWNPAAERIFGWMANEAIGKRGPELIVPEEAWPDVEHVWAKLLTGDEASYSLNANVRKDGKIITCEWFNASLRDASGSVSGVLSMVHDVTEKTELERQLQTAQRMESVGTLAGGIAHDFNNALTGIFGFGEMLRMRMAGDAKALHDLDEIQRCAERAATLTRQLLTFARRQIIEPVNLNLNTLVADLMKLIGKVVGEQIEVKTTLGKDAPTIHADRGQVEQVVMNLCLNARDAMPKGGRLLVETEDVHLGEEQVRQNPYMRTGRYALLTVSDTGIGMDEKTRERVFEPFFTTKGPDKGTGLGLAMVYGIVKQHGGFIHLYSEPGEGSSFKVYFPAVEAQPDAIPEKSREGRIRGGRRRSFWRKTRKLSGLWSNGHWRNLGIPFLSPGTGRRRSRSSGRIKGSILPCSTWSCRRRGARKRSN